MSVPDQRIHTLVSEQEVRTAVERVAAEIVAADPGVSGDLGDKAIHMVTIMQGGAWFSAALRRETALAGRIAREHQVTARRTQRDGVLGPVDINPDFEQDVLPILAGKNVLLVDDILDEGKTMQALAARIAPVAGSLQTAVLIRRARTEGHAITPDFVGLETEENGWLVGCGMDSDGQYRDLPYIGVRSNTR